jgi:hypothetical protein
MLLFFIDVTVLEDDEKTKINTVVAVAMVRARTNM